MMLNYIKEHLLGKKLPLYNSIQEDEVMLFQERVLQAQRFAKNELQEHNSKTKKSNSNGDVDNDDRYLMTVQMKIFALTRIY